MNKGYKKAISLYLVFALILSLVFGAVPLPAYAADAPTGMVEIKSDAMSVYMDPAFPSVAEYHYKGEVFYGRGQSETSNRTVAVGVVTNYNHNSTMAADGVAAPTNMGLAYNNAPTMTNYTAVVTETHTANTITYTLSFGAPSSGSGQNLTGVVIKVQYKVTGNVLEMKVTEVKDLNAYVRYLEFPDNALISVRGAQDEVAYNYNFANLDIFNNVQNLQLRNSSGNTATGTTTNKLKVGNVFLNTSKLAAAVESGITAQYSYIETKGSGVSKEVTVRPVDFMVRGPDKTFNELPWVKVIITDDINSDSKINWQDAAVAYREIMDPLTGENLARQTIAADIILNYFGKQAWTWENSLDYIKRKALATDNFPQIILTKGSHRQYGDGMPHYGDANVLLGGNDALNWLTDEAAKYNAFVGTHINSTEIYKESIFYEETPIRVSGAWAYVDRAGSKIAQDRCWRIDENYSSPLVKPDSFSNLMEYRYDIHKKTFPDMKFHYLDVSSGNESGYEARWTGIKVMDTYRKNNWTYFCEMWLNWINYDPNNNPTQNAVNPKYTSWHHTYYLNGDGSSSTQRLGNSDIRRFIVNDSTAYVAGTQDYRNVLGPGYYKGYGYLGWHEFSISDNITVHDSATEFWEHILADTYLKNFPLLSVDKVSSANITARFEDGVVSYYDGSKRTISKDGVVYGEINNTGFNGTHYASNSNNHFNIFRAELFMPWDPQNEEKIYAYSSSGEQRTWELPKSWQQEGVVSVKLYELDQIKGRINEVTVPVSNGKVTLKLDANKGYVCYKGEQAPVITVWGDNPPNYEGPNMKGVSQPKGVILDGNFNSGGLDYWTVQTGKEADVSVRNDREHYVASYPLGASTPQYYDNYYLRVNNEANVSQTITNLQPGKEYMVSARVWNEGYPIQTTRPTIRRKAYASVDAGANTVNSSHQGYNVITSEHYTYHAMNRWSIIKVYFKAESDTATLTLGTLAGTGAVLFDDIRLYQEDNPYGADGHYYKDTFETTSQLGGFIHENETMARLAWANPSKLSPGTMVYPEVHINGETTLMMGGSANTKIKSQPGMIKLEPNTGYNLSFKYKSFYGPAEGIHYTVVSPSTGNILVNQYLAAESGAVLTEKIPFRTDAAEDYIFVFDNEVNRSAAYNCDLYIDDLTLDINPNAINPPLMPVPTFETKSLLEAEDAQINADASETQGAIIKNDPNASGGEAVTRWQLMDEITFGPMAAANRFRIRYNNPSPITQTMQIWLKNEYVATLEFPTTDGYENIYFNYNLEDFARIKLVATGSTTQLYFDLLSVSPIYEAEKATLGGTTSARGTSSGEGASGGQFVWLDTPTNNGEPGSVTFNIQHNATELIVCQMNQRNGTTQSHLRYFDIWLNGVRVFEDVECKYTGPLSASGELLRFDLELKPGDALKFTYKTYNDSTRKGDTNNGMIDYIMLETNEQLPQVGTYTNVALNKPATQSRNTEAQRGNDGLFDAGTFSGGTSPASGSVWWQVDLLDVYDVTRTELYFKPIDRNDWFYKIEYSTDGTAWETAVDYTVTAASNTSPDPHVTEFASDIQARYFRITFTGVPVGTTYWYTFREFEVYGCDPSTGGGDGDYMDNIAYGKPVLPLNASEAEVTDAAAENLTDGNPDTVWTSGGSLPRIDLGLPYDITDVTLKFTSDTVPGEVMVYTSLNGIDWDTVPLMFTVPSGGGEVNISQSSILTRYFKLIPSTAGVKIVAFMAEGAEAQTPQKSIMILAPHPDDEALMFAGIIKRAIENGDDVYVLLATLGDYGSQATGRTRMNETITAMANLGLSKDNIFFLTYPDTGGLDSQSGQSFVGSTMYKMFVAEDPNEVFGAVKYTNTQTYNGNADTKNSWRFDRTGQQGSYTRNNFLEDLQTSIEEVMPDEVYTISTFDLHGDHAALQLFANEVIINIQKDVPNYKPVMFETLIHSWAGDNNWPVKNNDASGIKPFEKPAGIENKTILDWNKRVSVTVPEAMRVVPFANNMKSETIRTYASQMGSEAYLTAFAKYDEIFWTRNYDSLGYFAIAAASSMKPGSYDTSPTKAIDGIRDGYSESLIGTNPTHTVPRLPFGEWVSNGDGDGAWLELNWNGTSSIHSVTLYDRPMNGVNITGGKLVFDDESEVQVSELPDDGRPLTVTFPEKTTRSLKFVVTSHTGSNDVGLAEIEVFGTYTPGTWSYTVIYDKNGGDTGANPTAEIVANPALTVGALPTPPTRNGYDFIGWNTMPDGSGAWFTADTNVANDITVYAQWKEILLSNVVLNKPATQQIGSGSITSVAAGNDGDKSTLAPSQSGTGTTPYWWKVDLGSTHNISSTALWFKTGDRTSWKYKIEYSVDDVNWLPVADYSENYAPDTPSAPHVNEFENPIQARYFRVTFLAPPAGTAYWVVFGEFEASGLNTD